MGAACGEEDTQGDARAFAEDDEAGTTFTGTGLDDAFFSGHFTGTTSTTYYVKIDSVGTPDTFAVSIDNFASTILTNTAITGNKQLIHSADNIYVEFGATTGRPRKCNWLDTRLLRKAIKINGVTDLIVNKMDVLKEVQTWRVREGDKQFVYFLNEEAMKEHITIEARSSGVKDVSFSYSPEAI